MAINFPATPTLNQTYTYNGRTWTYNNVGWQATGSTGLTVYTKTNFTATAAQTSFSVTYTVGFVDVYYNGSKLSSSEYTATTGSTVVLGTACALNDIVETIAWTISSSFNPSLGSASATSLAIGGATIGSNALAVTGTTALSGLLTAAGGVSSTLTTDASSSTTGSIITAGGISTQKALFVGTTATLGIGTTPASITLNGQSGTGAAKGWAILPQVAGVAAGIIGSENYVFGSSDTNLVIQAPTSKSIKLFGGAGGSGLTISSTGALSAATADEVVGNFNSSHVYGSAIQFQNSSTTIGNIGGSAGYLGGAADDLAISVYGAHNLDFGNNGSLRARIDTSGNLLVGTTNNNGISSGTNGAVLLAAGGFRFTNGNGAAYFGVTATSGAHFNFYSYNGGAVIAGNVSTNGGTTSYNATSDERLKNWADIVQSNKRQMIENLWLGDYDKFQSFEKTGTPMREFGIRSQQAYGVLGDSSRILPPEKEDEFWSAPAEPFGFLALWGVKDLYKIIDELTTRLAALEAK